MPTILPKILERMRIRKNVIILGFKLLVMRFIISKININISPIFNPSSQPFLFAFLPISNPDKKNVRIGMMILDMAKT